MTTDKKIGTLSKEQTQSLIDSYKPMVDEFVEKESFRQGFKAGIEFERERISKLIESEEMHTAMCNYVWHWREAENLQISQTAREFGKSLEKIKSIIQAEGSGDE
jgi:hypothetical protein